MGNVKDIGTSGSGTEWSQPGNMATCAVDIRSISIELLQYFGAPIMQPTRPETTTFGIYYAHFWCCLIPSVLTTLSLFMFRMETFTLPLHILIV